MFRLSFCITVLLVVLTTRAAISEVQTWMICDQANPDDPESYIAFTLDDDGVLSINRTSVSTPGHSGSKSYWLRFSGQWAVCGSIDEEGVLHPDPYAAFVIEGTGGHIEWAPDSPAGYVAPLRLGYAFQGDGAATYQPYQFYNPGTPVTGTLVMNVYCPWWDDEYYQDFHIREHTFYVMRVQQVVVDIKPGTFPNTINCRSQSTIPVAICGSDTFDVSTIDPATVQLAGAYAKKREGVCCSNVIDVNDDGYKDLLLQFAAKDLISGANSTNATLTGETLDGTPIRGTDSVVVVK